MSDIEILGKYGHHPESEIDAEVEMGRLIGALTVAKAALLRGLDYRAATPEGLAIKSDLRYAIRQLDAALQEPK